MQKKVFYFLLYILLIGCDSTTKSKKSILCITSNQDTYGTTNLNTSNHFGEIVLAYDVFVKAGYSVDFVSPKGGAIPIGYIKTSDSIQKKYLYDARFMNKLKNTITPKEAVSLKYKGVYYSGGGAAMFGVAENQDIQNLVMEIYNANGFVSAVCHGTAGLVNLKTKEGTFIYTGKKLTGFPDIFEKKKAKYYQSFPFSIEGEILKNGGDFNYSDKGWDNFYIADGRLITGQDPSASVSVAKKVIELIEQNK